MARAHNQTLNLPPPFPASPSRLPTIGFYVNAKDGKFAFHNFSAIYAAKKFIDLLTDGYEIVWDNDQQISTSFLTIRGEGYVDLEKVIEHEYTPAERAWEIPEPYITMFRQFMNMPRYDEDRPKPEYAALPGVVAHSTPKKRTSERPARAQRTPRAPRDPSLTTIGDLAQQLGIEPTHARAALRKANVTKPDHGWAWPASELDAIRKVLKS